MKLPDNLNLPYFAYGLFKPGELAYQKVKKFVEGTPKEWNITNCRLWVRDGLPIIDLNSDGTVVGYGLQFRGENCADAYNTISNFVSIGEKCLYEWDVLTISDNDGNVINTLNVITWRNPPKTSIEIDIKGWTAKSDPMFTSAMSIIKKKIDDYAPSKFVYKPFEWNRFYELQMAYLLLWTAIERYCSFAYGPLLSTSEKRHELAQSVSFQDALKKVVRKNYHSHSVRVIHDSQNPDFWRKLNAANPIYSLGYYYLARCNLAHRGKSEWDDGNIIRQSLIELFEIFQIILKETLPN